MAASPEDGMEKSATLLIALGEDRASEVLKHLGPREVQKLGHAMALLKSVPRTKVEAVLDEFNQIAEESLAVHVDTDNYIRSVLTKARRRHGNHPQQASRLTREIHHRT